jgi:hypothetical protein
MQTARVNEVFDEFNKCSNKEQRLHVLRKHDSQNFREFLEYSFNPKIEFYFSQFPMNYIIPDTVPGISYSDLLSELKRLYLFTKGNPTADSLTEEKRNTLFLQVLETMDPTEATYFVNMMKKNLGVKYLTINLIKEAYNLN